MRKLIFQMMISVDGYYEGKDHDLSWHLVDDEFNAYAAEFLDKTGVLLFGRKTYELMASYWPSEGAIKDDSIIAEKMNSIPKIVVSKSLSKADWTNTLLVKENVIETLRDMKTEAGGDLVIFGSSDLVSTLIEHHLIDEFRMIVSPLFLGSGKTVMTGINKQIKLKLQSSRIFKSGSILLTYTEQQ
jgi:dihydrofolate reductase